MPLNPNREFLLELTGLVHKRVKVQLTNGKSYTGILRGIQDTTFNVVLADAEIEKEKGTTEKEKVTLHRIFITGPNIVDITLAEEPFDLAGLANELAQMFQPHNVKLIEESGIIQILDRFTVSEEGVKGTGPVADRIRKVFEKYKAKNQS